MHFATVAKLLHALGYSLQSNRKTKEGSSHPDRDAQFAQINETVKTALDAGQPAISVDTQEEGAGGGFQERRARMAAQGSPEPVRVPDFKDKQLGKAIPTGSTISPTTRGGSTSASTTTPPSSRSRRLDRSRRGDSRSREDRSHDH